MMVNWNRAINAGFLGAGAMTVFMIIVRGLGISTMNLEMMLGSLVTSTTGWGPWMLGLFIHLFVGGIFGLIYGSIMEILGRTGRAVGLGIAAVHTVLSGLILPLIGAMHPLVRSGAMPAPGIFASALGATGVILFIILHLLYGSIVGTHYEVISRIAVAESVPTRSGRPPSVVHRG